MAILGKDDFFSAVHAMVGDRTDDDSIAFTENMLDTYNDMERRANENSGAEWERKYKENDESWRKKYTHRFMTGGDCMNPNSQKEEEIRDKAETIKIDDLFSNK